MAQAEVSHSGKVVRISPQTIVVEIVSSSACSSCHAAGLCGVSESTVKTIEVPARAWDDFTVGEEVDVVLKASMGHKAVWLCYVVPLVVLVGVLLLALALGAGELRSALAAFCAVAAWYWLLYALRGRLEDSSVFYLRKKLINN